MRKKVTTIYDGDFQFEEEEIIDHLNKTKNAAITYVEKVHRSPHLRSTLDNPVIWYFHLLIKHHEVTKHIGMRLPEEDLRNLTESDKSQIINEIGRRITACRQGRGWSHADIARIIGLSDDTPILLLEMGELSIEDLRLGVITLIAILLHPNGLDQGGSLATQWFPRLYQPPIEKDKAFLISALEWSFATGMADDWSYWLKGSEVIRN